mmetsp:Transcript_62955/g.148304  ORF Transcript_62955/g.148304 Transcript_62955/m.148304 type:complete len:665 (+) Transcript_62955:1475-3469(+)
MVGRLVEQQDVCLHQHRSRQCHLHLPSAAECRDRLVEELVGEANRLQHSNHLLARLALVAHALVREDEVCDGRVGVRALDVVLDVDRPQHVWRRETLHLSVNNGLHQGGLSAAVGPAQAVSLAALHVEAGVGKEHHGAVAQRELHVAQVLPLLVLVLLHSLGPRLLEAELAQLRADVLDLLSAEEGSERLIDKLRPHRRLEVDVGDQDRRDGRDVEQRGVLRRARDAFRVFEKRVEEREDSVGIELLGLHRVGLEELEGFERLGGHRTRLRVRNLLRGLVDERHDLGHEGDGLGGVVDHLAHVVDDRARLASDVGRALLEPAEQQRHCHGQRRALDLLDEDSRCELVDAFGHQVRLEHALDDRRCERSKIAVVGRSCARLHRTLRCRHHLILGVPHRFCDLRHRIVQLCRHLFPCVSLSQGLQAVERADLDRPLVMPHPVEQQRQQQPEGLRPHSAMENLICELSRSFRHRIVLLARAIHDLRQELQHPGLSGGSRVLDDGFRGCESTSELVDLLGAGRHARGEVLDQLESAERGSSGSLHDAKQLGNLRRFVGLARCRVELLEHCSGCVGFWGGRGRACRCGFLPVEGEFAHLRRKRELRVLEDLLGRRSCLLGARTPHCLAGRLPPQGWAGATPAICHTSPSSCRGSSTTETRSGTAFRCCD